MSRSNIALASVFANGSFVTTMYMQCICNYFINLCCTYI